jgi:hypothetical protein
MIRYKTKCLFFLASLISIACTSTQKSSPTESTDRSCGPTADEYPVLSILSSHVLGGTESGPIRVAYTGSVPALAVLYSGNHLIFARNISKTGVKFYSYFCVKLSDAERTSLLEGIDDAMPELFEAFDAKDKSPEAGLTEIISFKSEHDCSQFELKGGIAAAREFGMRSRSSVSIKAPEALLESLDRFSNFDHSRASAWFPDQVLIEMRQLDDQESKKITAPVVNWPSSFKLTPLRNKDYKLQVDGRFKFFTTNVSTTRLKEFSTLMRSRIQREQKMWLAGYRFLLPKDHLWAAPHPTRGEEYSVCNKYIPRTNYLRLYGLNYLVSPKQ